MVIRLARPEIGEAEREAIERVLASAMLVQGREVERFEEELAARCERAHAVAVSSGTAALELALRALSVTGGEVIVPDLSWPSPAHAVVMAGARPVLIDVDPSEWNAPAAAFAAARSTTTRAAIAIDQFGAPARHGEILAALGALPIIEDAACAIGSVLAGKACGSFGVVSCLSFHPRKVVTTGEGGMCLTDDPSLARELRVLRNHGQSRPGIFERAAPNLRLTELGAAMGRAQMTKLDAMLRRRRALAARYRERLSSLPLALQSWPAGAEGNEQTFGVLIEDTSIDRDRVIELLRGAEIESGRLSYALHRLPSLEAARRSGALASSERIADRGLALPLHGGLGEREVDRVADALARALGS